MAFVFHVGFGLDIYTLPHDRISACRTLECRMALDVITAKAPVSCLNHVTTADPTPREAESMRLPLSTIEILRKS